MSSWENKSLKLPSMPSCWHLIKDYYCCCLVAELCLTLCNPMDYSPAGFSVHGISQASILEWVSIPFSRGSSRPRDRTHVSCLSRIDSQVLYQRSYQGSPCIKQYPCIIKRGNVNTKATKAENVKRREEACCPHAQERGVDRSFPRGTLPTPWFWMSSLQTWDHKFPHLLHCLWCFLTAARAGRQRGWLYDELWCWDTAGWWREEQV